LSWWFVIAIETVMVIDPDIRIRSRHEGSTVVVVMNSLRLLFGKISKPATPDVSRH